MVFVAVGADETPVGFIELKEDGGIDCFYCHPDSIGTGVGLALYHSLEATARSRGLTRLTVDASETAKGFF